MTESKGRWRPLKLSPSGTSELSVEDLALDSGSSEFATVSGPRIKNNSKSYDPRYGREFPLRTRLRDEEMGKEWQSTLTQVYLSLVMMAVAIPKAISGVTGSLALTVQAELDDL